jgi:hypothetical protein
MNLDRKSILDVCYRNFCANSDKLGLTCIIMDREHRKNLQNKRGNYFLNTSKVKKGDVFIKFLHPVSFTKNQSHVQKSIVFKVPV